MTVSCGSCRQPAANHRRAARLGRRWFPDIPKLIGWLSRDRLKDIKLKAFVFVWTVVLTLPALVHADVDSTHPPIEIHRRSAAITLHGDLSDPGWRDAARIDQFYEISPGDNTTPAAATTAFLTYDDRYLYIAVRCEDARPSTIRAPYVERDNVISTDDYVAIFLDTRNDRRTAIELRVNPRGIQGDATFNDGNGFEDFSPDYFYDAAATIDEHGWTAELRIPFSTLRYSHSEAPTWNILIARNYPRQYRYAYYSSPIPRGSNCTICHARPLVGLTALTAPRHVTVAPYVTGQQISEPSSTSIARARPGTVHSNAGADVKWTPSATGAIDLTLNPDFSEVEADVPQITANQRFALFFPEKRPFFLEGTDLFDTPLPVVYTRAITSPRLGIRNTARIGESAYTVLVADDRGGGSTIVPGPLSSVFAPRDFRSIDVVARVRREVGRSFLGAVFTDSEIAGGGHNRVLGPDFQWRPNADADSIRGELLISDNENTRRPDISTVWDGGHATSHAAYLSWSHQDRASDWSAKAADIGDKFRADLGFLPQNGYRELETYYARHFYPSQSLLSYVRPSLFFDQQNDINNRIILRRVSPGLNINGFDGLDAFAFLRQDQTRVGSSLLRATYIKWQVQIDPSRRFTRVTFTGTAGQTIDFANRRVGRGASLALTPTVRPIDNLTIDGDVDREWLDVDGGRLYTEMILRLKTTYNFSAKSFVRIIGQRVTTTRSPQRYSFVVPPRDGTFLGSILYSYIFNLQTALFLGYGDNRQVTPEDNLVPVNRSLFLKLSYALRM